MLHAVKNNTCVSRSRPRCAFFIEAWSRLALSKQRSWVGYVSRGLGLSAFELQHRIHECSNWKCSNQPRTYICWVLTNESGVSRNLIRHLSGIQPISKIFLSSRTTYCVRHPVGMIRSGLLLSAFRTYIRDSFRQPNVPHGFSHILVVLGSVACPGQR